MKVVKYKSFYFKLFFWDIRCALSNPALALKNIYCILEYSINTGCFENPALVLKNIYCILEYSINTGCFENRLSFLIVLVRFDGDITHLKDFVVIEKNLDRFLNISVSFDPKNMLNHIFEFQKLTVLIINCFNWDTI